MGKIVSAKCKECGYNLDKMFLDGIMGGGISSFQHPRCECIYLDSISCFI